MTKTIFGYPITKQMKAYMKLKVCKRCAKQYIKQHKCEVVETEQEAVKRSGKY